VEEIVSNPSRPPALLIMRGIRKSFPGVQAISSGAFELFTGEIHALVGENGAGKSTLIKILTGVHQADEGEILLDGHAVSFATPLESLHTGISAIHRCAIRASDRARTAFENGSRN